MKIACVLSLALAAGGLAGCNLKEKYARNNLAADRWLQANRGTASISVEGAWEAWESGWGEIRFEQVGSTVDGPIGRLTLRQKREAWYL